MCTSPRLAHVSVDEFPESDPNGPKSLLGRFKNLFNRLTQTFLTNLPFCGSTNPWIGSTLCYQMQPYGEKRGRLLGRIYWGNKDVIK